MFWVITAGILPARYRLASARWPRPGRASPNWSAMAKRRRHDSLRASWLARNSSNGIGLFLVHKPPGERKSGMPHSVEMPAPVKGTIIAAAWIMSARRDLAVSRSGAIIGPDPLAHDPTFLLTRLLTRTYLPEPTEVRP